MENQLTKKRRLFKIRIPEALYPNKIEEQEVYGYLVYVVQDITAVVYKHANGYWYCHELKTGLRMSTAIAKKDAIETARKRVEIFSYEKTIELIEEKLKEKKKVE